MAVVHIVHLPALAAAFIVAAKQQFLDYCKHRRPQAPLLSVLRRQHGTGAECVQLALLKAPGKGCMMSSRQASVPSGPAAGKLAPQSGLPGTPHMRRPLAVLCSPRTLTLSTAVRQFSFKDDPEAAARCIATAAEALGSDPSTSYYCAPGKGEIFISTMLQSAVKGHPALPQLYSLQQETCVAIAYQYPKPPQPDPWQQVVSILQWPWTSFRWSRIGQGMRSADTLERLREGYLRAYGPYLYISVLATAPQVQRQGLGSTLLEHLIQQADASGLHTYLEASSSSSQRFYLAHGFANVVMLKPATEVPGTFVMARPPLKDACKK